MALASRLGQTVGLAGLTGPAKLLAVNPCNNKMSKASVYSKTSGMLEERPKPWNYTKYGYNYLSAQFDRTTKRFNDNSKLIIVEGPPGLNKGKLTKELADELDMLYIPGVSMEDWYINSYGYDLRELDHLFEYPVNVSFDEKKFAQNPLARSDGAVDKMVFRLWYMRYRKYVDALAHIFNTGQGVVMEKSVYSDYVFVDACLQMGWIHKSTKKLINKMKDQAFPWLLRPHLLLYLHAPVDVVQAKIRERANTTHPWEKNSPVFENTSYLQLLYDDLLKNYIKDAARHSRVLMYDWSDGGDTEVVVEDMERLNLDFFDKYDPVCKDWRMHKEENYTRKRLEMTSVTFTINNLKVETSYAEKILKTSEEHIDFVTQAYKVPGNRFSYGYNPAFGENWTARIGGKYESYQKEPYYHLEPLMVDNEQFAVWDAMSKAKKEAGEEKYWQFNL